jgi:DNA-directed RNA polymerase subunit RPC12/RpoP
LPAAAVATYDAADLPDLMDRWVRKTTRAIRAEICPYCSGRLDGRLVTTDTDRPSEHVTAPYTCRQCGQTVNGTVSWWLLEHPAVVQFMMNRGVDPREWTPWSEEWRAAADRDRSGTDPPQVAVRVTLDGDTLELVVDESVEVVNIRQPRS